MVRASPKQPPKCRPAAEKVVARDRGTTWVLAHFPGELATYGEFGQCASDVYVLKRRRGLPDEVHNLTTSQPTEAKVGGTIFGLRSQGGHAGRTI